MMNLPNISIEFEAQSKMDSTWQLIVTRYKKIKGEISYYYKRANIVDFLF